MLELGNITKQRINSTIEKKFGISYEEFEKLDYSDQQKLIQNCRSKRGKNKNINIVMIGNGEHAAFMKVKKGTLVMIGEGEHSCFVEVGLTDEESRQRLDKKLYSRKEKVINAKNKVLSLKKNSKV